ncbi:VOC family protein [Hymenobacter sp. 15J16-1T3B]|uniref:VOC family protein n=1 Tax=Hymenobacter sp. 15J16-1T3B TaxID=2886941 RepID=UPI001D11EA19|nr:VOC family protein [Hymenobacter sp. 15J16-1T3B]MCC3158439.1 VOC family protein [Hymenobacter sp. 15J16-1T3B]
MKLEVVVIGVADVDRAKAFYTKLGWRLDADFVKGEDFRVVQVTPYHSGASVIFGKNVTATKPGAVDSLVLAVADIDAARAELVARGVAVSEVFHYAGGPFNNAINPPRVSGRDPQGHPYYTFASFQDPDGNGWLLQEVKTRLPGREWAPVLQTADVATLTALLRETAEQHDVHGKAHGEHQWWDWYAPYLSAREQGSSPEAAAAAANHHMEEVLLKV